MGVEAGCVVSGCALPLARYLTCEEHEPDRLLELQEDDQELLPQLSLAGLDRIFGEYADVFGPATNTGTMQTDAGGVEAVPSDDSDAAEQEDIMAAIRDLGTLVAYATLAQVGLTKEHYNVVLTMGLLSGRTRAEWVPADVLRTVILGTGGSTAPSGNFEAAITIAERWSELPVDLQEALARHPDRRARLAVAGQTLPPALRAELMGDSDLEVALRAHGVRRHSLFRRPQLELSSPLDTQQRKRVAELLAEAGEKYWGSVPYDLLPNLNLHEDDRRREEVVAHLVYAIEDRAVLEVALQLFEDGYESSLDELISTAPTFAR